MQFDYIFTWQSAMNFVAANGSERVAIYPWTEQITEGDYTENISDIKEILFYT